MTPNEFVDSHGDPTFWSAAECETYDNLTRITTDTAQPEEDQ